MAPITTNTDDYIDYATTCAVPADIAAAAAERMVSDPPVLLACSGKLVAGKDTIPPAVYDALGRPADQVVHLYYAAAVKNDLDELLGDVRNATDPVAALARRDIPPTAAAHLVGLLSDELTADATVTGRSRTPGIRAALQYYGTDVRRVQDPDYWVKRALGPAVRAVAAGFDVYFSDIRFPNEVAGARRLGFHVVRLLISPQTQRARLLERDGLEPDPEAVNHPSETALDDYDGFDQVLDNNGTVDAAVSRILAALSHRAST